MSKTRWIQIISALTLLFALGFVLVGNRNFEVWLKGHDVEWVSHHRKVAAMLFMVLLGSDMFMPVPSSVVMTLNGKLFGFAAGAGVSFVGSMLAWTGCYWLGRLFGWGGQRKPAPADDPAGAASANNGDIVSREVKRYGVGLLIATRPVPILAELSAAACGVARMHFLRFLVGAALGVLPMSVLYSYVGHYYHTERSPWIALVIAIAIPLALYLLIARPWANRR